MRLLLDTHALLWWLADIQTLSLPARDAIAHPDNIVAVSAASTWEISIKRSLGKLVAPEGLEAQLVAGHFLPLPITLADGLIAGALPPHHADPFDRMLVAQSRAGNWTLVTRDSRMTLYGIDVLPA